MTARTPTSYAVLGLLAVRSWTTYELAKQVQRSLNWFWPRAERKLYDEPKRLVEQGLATSIREATGQRPRTVYAITDDGRSALKEWLDEPPAPRSIEFEGMVKVFFADSGSLDQLRTTLDRLQTGAEQKLAELATYASSRPMAFPNRAHISAITLRLQYEQEDAVRRWAAWAREQVADWDATDHPGAYDSDAVLHETAAMAAAAGRADAANGQSS